MHFCFLTYGSWERNAGMYRCKYLGEQLTERGHRVTYMVDDVPFNRDRGNLGLHPRAEIAYVPRPRTAWQFRERRRLLRELRPDFVHVLNSHAKTYLTLAPLRDQRIIADWDEPPTLKDLGFLRNRLESFVDRWLRKRASTRIACTSFLQAHFREHYGIETAYVPHAPYLTHRDDGTSPFDRPTAVYMGNLWPLWDHDVILRAARLLRERGQKPPMLLMGDGPDMDKWKAFLAEHGLDNVTLGGFVSGDELWLRLRHAHVLLFPIRDTVVNRSRCPSKVFAYAQARRPIITSAVGELPYMLGSDATYIESTPEAFADAIAEAMSRPSLPDVDYRLDQHSWSERCDRLLHALNGA